MLKTLLQNDNPTKNARDLTAKVAIRQQKKKKKKKKKWKRYYQNNLPSIIMKASNKNAEDFTF